MRFTLNGTPTQIPKTLADEPLLFALRDHFALNGPKFGCGVGSCGACTVIVDGAATRSCTLATAAVEDATVTTLEGLANGDNLHPVQQAWIAHSVPQCGYCQNGQIMTAVALLAAQPDASESEIAATMSDVLCRCGTHTRIRKAIHAAQTRLREDSQ